MTSSPSCTCSTLRKLSRSVSRLYDWHMAEAGLKTTQYSLLKNIDHAAVPIAALATRLAIDRTTLTRNLKPLIDAGWAMLSPSADARQRIVTITAAGHAKVASAGQAWCDAQHELERTIGVVLVRTLQRDAGAAMRQLTPFLKEKLDAKLD